MTRIEGGLAWPPTIFLIVLDFGGARVCWLFLDTLVFNNTLPKLDLESDKATR